MNQPIAHFSLRMATIEPMSADVPIPRTGRRDRRQRRAAACSIGSASRIAEGEHTAIIGPNGAGKSILVSLLTQEQRPLAPSNGTPPVRVFGRQNWDLFELRSQLGIISADLHQHFVNGNSEGSITAEAAVVSAFLSSYGILRYGTVTDVMREQAAAALEAAGASRLTRPHARRDVERGSAPRAAGPSLVTSPRALVLDEPTTGLDLVARHGFMETVRQLARAGTTVVLITHHIEEIFPEIERVILLRDGRVMADGPAAPTSPTRDSLSCSNVPSPSRSRTVITMRDRESRATRMTIRDVLVPLLVARFQRSRADSRRTARSDRGFSGRPSARWRGAHLRSRTVPPTWRSATSPTTISSTPTMTSAERRRRSKASPMTWSVFWTNCLPIAC